MTLRGRGERRDNVKKPRSPWSGALSGDYMKCNSALRGGLCKSHHNFRYAPIEKMILDVLSDAMFDPNEFNAGNESKVRALENKIGQIRSRISEIEKQAEAGFVEITRTPEALRAIFHRTLNDLANDRDDFEQQRRQMENELALLRGKVSPTDLAQAITALRLQASQSEGEDTFLARGRIAECLRRIVDQIIFDGGERSVTVVAGGYTAAFLITSDTKVRFLPRSAVDLLRSQAPTDTASRLKAKLLRSRAG